MSSIGVDVINTVSIGASTFSDTIRGSVFGRVASGASILATSTMDTAAETTSKAYLKENGYQYTAQFRNLGGALSEAQIAVTYLPHVDARVTGVRKDLGNVVQQAISAIQNQNVHDDLPPDYDDYVAVRLTCPVPVDYREFPGPTRCFDTERVGIPPLRRTVPHGQPGCPCAECVMRFNSHPFDVANFEPPTPGCGECLSRLIGSPFWIPSDRTKRRMSAKVLLVSELFVLDVFLPYQVYRALDTLTTSVTNAGEKEFAKHLTMRAVSAVNSFLNRDEAQPMSAADAMALTKVAIATMSAMACDKATTHVQFVEVKEIHGGHRTEEINTVGLADAIDDAENAMEDAYGEHDGGLPLRAATETSGELPRHGVVFYPDDEALSKYALEIREPGIGGVRTGANVLGKQPPIDTKDPQTMFSAVTRHFCDVRKEVPTDPDDATCTYRFAMSKADDPKEFKLFGEVLHDIFGVLTKLTNDGMMNAELAFDVDEDGRPGSMTATKYFEALFDDQLTGSSPETSDLVKFQGSLFCKSGEDGDRARFISIPGANGTEALHQARLSAPIKLLEMVCKRYMNHKGIKGLDEDAKRQFFGEFIGSLEKDEVGLSFDKSANDRTWGITVWNYFVKEFTAWIETTILAHFTNTYVYTSDERANAVKLRMKHAYGVFSFSSEAIFLLSGIGPTSLFNRLCAMCEAGVLCRSLYGENAYRDWLHDLAVGPSSSRTYWLTHWRLGNKRLPTKTLKLKDVNEGDDKILALRRSIDPKHVMADGQPAPDRPLTVAELTREIVTIMANECGMIYEVAFTPMPESNTGRKTVFEFCSTIIAIDKEQEEPVATLVPKPMKALNKLAWSATRAVNFKLDDDQVAQAVIMDARYHAYCVTKFCSLAILNRDSPIIGKIFRSNAEYHYGRVIAAVGVGKAKMFSTNYQERAPELRQLEEWRMTTYQHLGEMMDALTSLVAQRVFSPRETYAAAVGWMMDLPELKDVPLTVIMATLLEGEQEATMLTYDDSTIYDPVFFYNNISLGPLAAPLIWKATCGYRKMLSAAVQGRRPRQETIDRVADAMHGITKTTLCGKPLKPLQPKPTPTQPNANATDHGAGKGKGGNAMGSGKGRPPSDASGKGKGKPTKGSTAWQHAKGKGRPGKVGNFNGSRGDERATATHRHGDANHRRAGVGPA